MNQTITIAQTSIKSKIGLSIDCRTGKILVDIDAICEAHGIRFDLICMDEQLINSILDTYSDMQKVYKLNAPF